MNIYIFIVNIRKIASNLTSYQLSATSNLRHLCILCVGIACLCSLFSCAGGNDSYTPAIDDQSNELRFSATVGGAETTRADVSMVSDGYTEFGVWGLKYMTSTTQTVMSNYKVRHDANIYHYQNTSEHWGYDGQTNISGNTQYIKYWDDENPWYQFVGYAPYCNADDDADISVESNKVTKEIRNISTRYGNVNVPDSTVAFYNFVRGNIKYTHDNDFIIAHYQRKKTMGKDILDNTAEASCGSLHANVPLGFNRLTSVVEFRIYQAAPSGWVDPGTKESNFTYTALQLQINNFYDKADVYENYKMTTLTNEAVNYATAYNASYRTNVEYINSKTTVATAFGEEIVQSADIPLAKKDDATTYEKYAKTVTPAGGIIQIPQSGVDLTATVTVPNHGSKTVTITDQTWEANKRYIYYLVYPASQNEDIKVVLEEIAWHDGGEQRFEQTNW